MGGLFDTRSLRGLRGGSGGGSSGGGGSGGGGRGGSYGGGGYGGYGYGGYRNNYGTNGGDDDSIPIWAIVLISVAGFLLVFCFCMCMHKKYKKGNGSGPSPGSDPGFDGAVSDARGKFMENGDLGYASVSDPASNFETYSGNFEMKYIHRGSVEVGSSQIRLKKAGDKYEIEGESSDADGIASITEGFALPTGDAWWVEETLAGTDKGLKVLTEGKFDFTANTFAGTWRANTGIRGSYTEFVGNNISKTFSPQGATASNPQTLDQMLQEDIPVAVATLENPMFATAPPMVQAMPESSTAILTVSAAPEPSSPPYSPSTQSNAQEVYVPRF